MAIRARKKQPAYKSLGCRNRSFDRFLASQCDVFASLQEHEKCYMASALWGWSGGRFLHNSGDSDLIPHHWETKQAVFGSAKRFDEVNSALGWFVLTLKPKIGKSAGGWTVTAKAKKLTADYLQRSRQMLLTGLEEPESGLINADGSVYRMQRDGIQSKTRSGKTSKHARNVIDTAVPINGDTLHEFDEAADAWLYGEECPPGFDWAFKKWNEIRDSRSPNRGREYARDRVEKAKAQASKLLDIAKCSNVPGFVVPTRYIESEAGRLYAEGMINLQRCYSEVRQAAFIGCYDVDFENCHWALLSQMAAREGMETPAITRYLNNKKATRLDLALAAGISEDDAKFMLVAMIYGATLSSSIAENRLAITRRLGWEAVERALAFEPLVALNNDVKRARKAVIAAYIAQTKKAGVLVNDFGNEIALAADDKEQLAHILQGAEALALRSLMTALKGDVLLLQHDGLTCKTKPNKADLENRILSETGFRLTLEIDQL